jgi:hypothetical protein
LLIGFAVSPLRFHRDSLLLHFAVGFLCDSLSSHHTSTLLTLTPDPLPDPALSLMLSPTRTPSSHQKQRQQLSPSLYLERPSSPSPSSSFSWKRPSFLVGSVECFVRCLTIRWLCDLLTRRCSWRAVQDHEDGAWRMLLLLVLLGLVEREEGHVRWRRERERIFLQKMMTVIVSVSVEL